MEKTVQNIPFLRLSIALAIGIFLGSRFLQLSSILLFAVILLILIVVLIFKGAGAYRIQLTTGLLFNFVFIVAGIYFVQQYNQKPSFYKDGQFKATILESPQEKTNAYQTTAKISSFIGNDSVFNANEQIIIYFAKTNEVLTLEPGSNIIFKTNPQKIKNFGNPYEFDYKKYLERKKIYRQVYLDKNSWWQTQTSNESVFIIAENFRQKLLGIYKQLPINEKELEILSALTLGYKRDLDPDTKRVFSSAGAMHVLAVSGLHVGIVFWIIVLLFGYLRKHKNGRVIFTVIATITLWTYAFITGLAPSVMRATTMFTIYILGELLYRKSNVYNSLAAAAFILLLFNPNNLFETGFQLSFSAVFGIVFLQPKLSSILKVDNKILKFFWELFTVSVAAQLATLPFTLYYFGQFPTYFFITNIVIIPAIMVLIPLGISILFISKIQILANVISGIINGLIKAIFLLLNQIEQLPFSVIDTSITGIRFLLLVSLILTFFILLKSRRTFYIHLFLTWLLFLVSTSIFENLTFRNKNEMIVYNNPENATLELIHGKSNIIISEFEINENASVIKSIDQTTKKRRLDPPQFFTVNDSVINNFMFLDNNMIYFEGKTIFFGNISNINFPAIPDFIIIPTETEEYTNNNPATEIIITNKRYNKSNQNTEAKNMYIASETAFQKIW